MDPPLVSPVSFTPLRDSLSPQSKSKVYLKDQEPELSSKQGLFKFLRKLAEEQKLNEKWAATAQSKKFALRAKRASLNDFDRFKVMINRKNRAFKLRHLAKKISGGGAQKQNKSKAKK